MSPESFPNVLFRLDSGANMFVTNDIRHFVRYRRQVSDVTLGLGVGGSFQAVGFVIVSIPGVDNWRFLLYPTFFAPNDSYCTISSGALKQHTGFTSVLIDTNVRVNLRHKSGSTFTMPVQTINCIDYIRFHIHTIKSSTKRDHLEYRHLSLQPAPIQHKMINGTPLHSLMLHITRGHRSIAVLQQMIDKKLITGPGYPCKLAPLPGRCPICDAAAITKLPRGPPRDTTELPVGVRWHLDFTFFNVESVRGFSACLIIVEATSRYIWIFPCASKSAPVDICMYFFTSLQRRGIPCSQLRSDEDGALVGNTEFCEIMYKVTGMSLESTGGGESSLNGTVETPNKTIKRMVRANLMGALMPDPFWCFSAQYAGLQHNNTLNRRTGSTPAIIYLGRAINEAKLQPWGCRCKVIDRSPSGRALRPRTSGDPRLAPANLQVISRDEAASIAPSETYHLRFMGYSNNPAVILAYNPNSKAHRIRRLHHAILDPYGLSVDPDQPLLPNEHLLRVSHGNLFRPDNTPPETWRVELTVSDLEEVDSPFDANDLQHVKIILPPKGQSLGLTFITDEDYMLPVLYRVDPSYPVFDRIPLQHHYSKSWVTSVASDKPLTASGVVDLIHRLQVAGEAREISIGLHPIKHPVRFSPYQTYRSIFDSMTGLRCAHMVHLPSPPRAPKTFWEALQSSDRNHWVSAADAQYEKNQRINLCSAPEPVENVPPDRKILPVVLAPKIKALGNDIYQFIARMCANGSSMLQGIDFDHSWSPTISAIAVRVTLYYAAMLGLTLSVLDVVNCFQSTLLPEKDCLIIRAPFGYVNWFQHTFPNIKINKSPSGKYVLQIMGRGLQGDKCIGRRWYLLLKKLLEKFGFSNCLPEPALFIYRRESHTMLVCVSTDDLLVASSHDELFTRLHDYLVRFFDITVKQGMKLSYLNFRIIQSSLGISYDQTEHILRTIVHKFFPPESTTKLKTVHTPFRTDSQFEQDLAEQLPAIGQALIDLQLQYGGTYPEIIGQLMHVYVWSRHELGFALARLSRYIQGPTAAAFAGLYRIIRFLATHPHRPTMLPRRIIDGYHTLRVDFDPPKFESIDLPNGLICIVDADHARDQVSRRSVESILLLFAGCVMDWKQHFQRIIALHSTDAETRAAFTAAKRATHLQDVAEFIGFDKSLIAPVPVFIDSQPCIDILEANTVTTRVKHIAVPIHYIHHLIYQRRLKIHKIGTHLNLADSGTKPNPSPVLFRHHDHINGKRFYPPPRSDHYEALDLTRFIKSPYDKTP